MNTRLKKRTRDQLREDLFMEYGYFIVDDKYVCTKKCKVIDFITKKELELTPVYLIKHRDNKKNMERRDVFDAFKKDKDLKPSYDELVFVSSLA